MTMVSKGSLGWNCLRVVPIRWVGMAFTEVRRANSDDPPSLLTGQPLCRYGLAVFRMNPRRLADPRMRKSRTRHEEIRGPRSAHGVRELRCAVFSCPRI